MKHLRIVLALLALWALRCGADLAGGSSETGNAGVAFLRIETFDSPASGEIENVFIRVRSIELRHETFGWVRVDTPDTVIDFLSLVAGRTALLCDTTVPAGYYDQMRIVLGDGNTVVVAGQIYPLIVPSGLQSGIKISFGLRLIRDDSATLYLDFDAGRSIAFSNGQYKLSPKFSAVAAANAAVVEGFVRDTAGVALARASVQAAGADTAGTRSGSGGYYRLVVPAGTYDITCSAPGYATVDTSYTDLQLAAKQIVTEMNFRLGR